MTDQVDEFLKNYVGEWTNKQEREIRELLKKQRSACAKAAYPFITADGEVYTKILNASIEE